MCNVLRGHVGRPMSCIAQSGCAAAIHALAPHLFMAKLCLVVGSFVDASPRKAPLAPACKVLAWLAQCIRTSMLKAVVAISLYGHVSSLSGRGRVSKYRAPRIAGVNLLSLLW